MVVALLLSACSSGADKKSSGPASETQTEKTGEETTQSGQNQEPPTELRVAFLVTGSQPADESLIEEELNKILIPEINVKVDLLPINFGAAMQQYNLMLSSGEKLDLMLTFPYTYTNLVGQGQIQEIGPLLDQYGQGIKEVLGEYLKGSVINGKIYGVTPWCDKAGSGTLIIRKDKIEKYNIDTSKVKTLSDIGEMFRIIKENEPDAEILGYSAQGSGLASMYFSFSVDTLGDGFGVLMDYGKELKVVNLYETQEYVDFINTMRDWYTKGYIMKDIATAKEDQHTLMKAEKMYAYFSPGKPGIAEQESAQNGYECLAIELSPGFSKTSNVSIFQWVVPNACEAPEKAVQLLNLMYTDPRVVNLMSWGIEGKHYEKKTDGTIGFPEGLNDQSSGWFLNTPWMFGNGFLAHVWEGNDVDLWDQTEKFNNEAIISKAMGFTYDPTPVKNEVAALTNVYDQYKMSLEGGAVDPSEVYPQFVERLKQAGIDKVIAEKQRQLDEWAAANNVN